MCGSRDTVLPQSHGTQSITPVGGVLILLDSDNVPCKKLDCRFGTNIAGCQSKKIYCDQGMHPSWGLAFDFLSASELGNVSLCCKDFAQSSSDPYLWRCLFEYDFFGNRGPSRKNDGKINDVEIKRVQRPRGLDAIGWTVEVFDEVNVY
jgi:hypothetical protein